MDLPLLDSLLSELAASPASTLPTRLAGTLDGWYKTWNEGYASYGATEAILAHEADELIRIQTEGLLGAQLTSPRDDVWCSFEKKGEPPTLAALQPGKCSNSIGPELILGHYLGQRTTLPISFVKVAQGGTTLETDWLSPSAAQANGNGATVGPLYEQLATRIKSMSSDATLSHPDCATRTRAWSAFVWFQGENDTFSATGGALYESNLRHLIADVRAETGTPSLPVVILQIGTWAHGNSPSGDSVYLAQAKVASTIPGASLVGTDDLSGFYHYDSAAQLIIGERVARVLP